MGKVWPSAAKREARFISPTGEINLGEIYLQDGLGRGHLTILDFLPYETACFGALKVQPNFTIRLT